MNLFYSDYIDLNKCKVGNKTIDSYANLALGS